MVASLIINGALFGLVSSLSRERTKAPDLYTTIPISVVHLPRPERPLELEVKEEIPKPAPQPVAEIALDLARPQIERAEMPPLVVRVNPNAITMPSLAGEFVFNAGELDQPPRSITAIDEILGRHYPSRARRMGVEGFVRARYLVDENGLVSRLTILSASPPGLFEKAVENALPMCRYTPGRIGGKAVPAWVENKFVFELEQ